jgi:hypothetical protein
MWLKEDGRRVDVGGLKGVRMKGKGKGKGKKRKK